MGLFGFKNIPGEPPGVEVAAARHISAGGTIPTMS